MPIPWNMDPRNPNSLNNMMRFSNKIPQRSKTGEAKNNKNTSTTNTTTTTATTRTTTTTDSVPSRQELMKKLDLFLKNSNTLGNA